MKTRVRTTGVFQSFDCDNEYFASNFTKIREKHNADRVGQADSVKATFVPFCVSRHDKYVTCSENYFQRSRTGDICKEQYFSLTEIRRRQN